MASEIGRVLAEYRPKLPPGSTLAVRGQVESMRSAFLNLGLGLAFAVVLVYLLMVVNFQSWLDPFIIIITALPGAFCGIVWMLFATQTTAGPTERPAVPACRIAPLFVILSLVGLASGR